MCVEGQHFPDCHLPAILTSFLFCSSGTFSVHRISFLKGNRWSLIFFHKLAQCLGLGCLKMFIEWIKGLQPEMLRRFDFSFIMHPFNSQPVSLIFQIWRLMTYISTPIKHMNSLLFITLPLIFFSIVFFSQTAPKLLIKAPSCRSHDTQYSLIPLVLSIAMPRHLFVTRLLGASQLELLNIIVHSCKDTLHSCLPWVPFLCASRQAQAVSPTQSLPDQLLILSPLLSLLISRLNLISGNWIPSWRWETALQRSHNCSLLLGGYSSWRWRISELWNHHAVRLRATRVEITCF